MFMTQTLWETKPFTNWRTLYSGTEYWKWLL